MYDLKRVLIIACVSFVIGLLAGYYAATALHKCPEAKKETKIEYVDRVKTEVAYIPKEVYIDASGNKVTEKTDLEITVPKTELNIKVNGKETTFSKADNESYLFEKNKLTLNQSSSADINIKIPTVDNTRKWGLGVGASKNGLAGALVFPLKSNVGGWVSGDKENVAGGIMIRF